MAFRPRIGVACPIPGERAALLEWLTAGGFEPVPMIDAGSIARELEGNSFEVLVIDAELACSGDTPAVLRMLGTNRPQIVIGDPSATTLAEPARHEVTYLQRPVPREVLSMAIALALAEGRPARRSPRREVGRIQSTVDGVAARVLDVSNEGIRLEFAERYRSSIPPYFTVRVPTFGVGVVVQRVWLHNALAESSRGKAWCGVRLSRNPDRAMTAWLRLVEHAPLSSSIEAVARDFF